VRVHISTKWSDLNISTTTTTTTPATRKGEGKGRAASLQREEEVTANVVCAMTSLPLWVIMYTEGMTDRTANLLISSNVHYAHLGGDNNFFLSLCEIQWMQQKWANWCQTSSIRQNFLFPMGNHSCSIRQWRQIASGKQTHREPQWGLRKHSRGPNKHSCGAPLRKNWIFCVKYCTLVYLIFLSDGRAPQTLQGPG